MQRLAAVLTLSLCSTPLLADTPDQILGRYAGLAKQEDPAFAGFSAEHGHELYFQGKGSRQGVRSFIIASEDRRNYWIVLE